ncbi:MAG: DUF6702 family protein [Bacteroidota bacterium]
MGYLLFIPLYLSLSIISDHAIYISVLEIDNQRMKVKVFSDNLNDAIRNDANSIEGYFQKKIKLKVNEMNVSFTLDEVTEEGDSYWITFKLSTPNKWNSFYLEADYFMELFPDQTNVVKVIGEKPQFFRLTKLNPTCSFTD